MGDQRRDPDDPTSDVEGPSPSEDDADVGEAMEELISAMDRPLGAADHTTVQEQMAGDSIDERTRREQPQRVRRPARVDLTEDPAYDGLDESSQMLATEAEAFGPLAPEETAMHVVDDAPGATDHPDDYVVES